MRSKAFFLLKMFILVIASSAVLALFLILCYLVPLNESHFYQSIAELEAEGWYSDVLEQRPGYSEYFFSEAPSIHPVFNDKMDYIRAGGISDKSALYNAMAMEGEGGFPYPRYWHGYAGILRLLLVAFDCKEIKFMSFIFQMLLVVFILIKLSRVKDIRYLLLFITQYILLMPLTVSFSMVFAFSIDIALLGILALLYFHKQINESYRIYYFFCQIGLLTCFFEELVFGLLTWGMVILWAVILYGQENKVLQNIKTVIFTALSWIWGYAGVWVMKWVYASLTLGENILLNGYESVVVRSSSTNETDNVGVNAIEKLADRFRALRENYEYYFYSVFFLILLIWVIYFLFKYISKNTAKDSRVPALGLIALAPATWYFVLANHTLGHRFMTWRIWNPSVIAVLFIVLLSSGGSSLFKSESAMKKRNISVKGISLLISGILAIVCTGLMTDELETKNIGIPGQNIEFSEFSDGIARTTIVPQYKVMKDVGFILSPIGSEGEYDIRLMLGEKIVQEKILPMDMFHEAQWRFLEYDWDVIPGVEYTLEIEPKCENGMEGSVCVCIPGPDKIPEIGYIQGNDAYPDAQITCSINYITGLLGRKRLFFGVSWFMVFMSVCLIIQNVFAVKKKGTLENG